MYSRIVITRRQLCRFGLAAFVLGAMSCGLAYGQPPVPIIKNLEVTASVSFDSAASRFVYAYRIRSLPSNTGNVSGISIDITTDLTQSFFIDNPIPEYRSVVLQRLGDKGINILPVQVTAPTGWHGVNLTALGTADWGEFSKSTTLGPGQSVAGFILTSAFVPGLRTVTVSPDISTWNLYPNASGPEEVQAQQEALIKSLDFVGQTLGPVGVFPGTFAHWNQLRDDLNRMITELNWVDPTLGATLQAQLAVARTQLDDGKGTAAKTALTLLATLAQAPATQIRAEARQLVQLNAQSLIAHTPDTPAPTVPFEPKLEITPKVSELPVGATYTLTVNVVNVADNNRPVPDFDLDFKVIGVHGGQFTSVHTDAQGLASFSFVGTRVGDDRIEIFRYAVEELVGEARVTWAGGPDLTVPFFMPPRVSAGNGSDRLVITDITANFGTIAAPPSVTRYFLSNVEPVNPATATVIGERPVEALDPEEFSTGNNLEFRLPGGLSPGTFFLAACADANATVVELEETNNCSFNRLANVVSVVMQGVITNRAPDCGHAAANPSLLWPPNHKLVTIGITGVTDPDGDPVNLIVTRIEQDEPVNGLGDGDTSPDGFGVGTAQASVRRERSGLRNGRVYQIDFSAKDNNGASCTGSVSVGVPHDQGQGSTPIDDGVRFDSTQL